jgi:type III restriction enzyme
MDPGAHVCGCDLQVHSPRDRNWRRECPNGDEERKRYAESFVFSCRSKGLQAVAITDHHDLAFFPYIRNASLAELDLEGIQAPGNDRLIVLSGIELFQIAAD